MRSLYTAEIFLQSKKLYVFMYLCNATLNVSILSEIVLRVCNKLLKTLIHSEDISGNMKGWQLVFEDCSYSLCEHCVQLNLSERVRGYLQ